MNQFSRPTFPALLALWIGTNAACTEPKLDSAKEKNSQLLDLTDVEMDQSTSPDEQAASSFESKEGLAEESHTAQKPDPVPAQPEIKNSEHPTKPNTEGVAGRGKERDIATELPAQKKSEQKLETKSSADHPPKREIAKTETATTGPESQNLSICSKDSPGLMVYNPARNEITYCERGTFRKVPKKFARLLERYMSQSSQQATASALSQNLDQTFYCRLSPSGREQSFQCTRKVRDSRTLVH